MIISRRKIRRTIEKRNRLSRKKKITYLYVGGKSYTGIRPIMEPITTLERFANYWNEYKKCNVWYSTGQDGYYFSNLKNFYMSKTHTHIYKIDDLDDNKDGLKRVHYSTKIKNHHIEKNVTIDIQYFQITSWLTRKNEEIGADGYIDPIHESEQ